MIRLVDLTVLFPEIVTYNELRNLGPFYGLQIKFSTRNMSINWDEAKVNGNYILVHEETGKLLKNTKLRAEKMAW